MRHTYDNIPNSRFSVVFYFGDHSGSHLAKMIVTIFCMLLCLSACAAITNIVQCLNLELTTDRLSQFPSCDNSNPQNALLGFVRGSITGDYLSFLMPLSDAARVEEVGVSDLSQVTPSMTNQFYTFVISTGFSNHVVCAYSEIATNNIVQSTTFIRSRCGLMNKTNELQTTIQQIDGSWRIVKWDVEE